MIRFKYLFVLFTLIFVFSPLHAASLAKELNWSSVNLSGMHLRLVSPKSNTESQDLYFHADGNLSISSCNDGWCVGPLMTRSRVEKANSYHFDGHLLRAGERIRATAIPYYLWSNRGAGEMTVWLNTVPEQTFHP